MQLLSAMPPKLLRRKNSRHRIKDQLKGEACVLDNMDRTYALTFGTQEEVVEIMKDTIRKAAPGGGYILSSSNSVHPGCKRENVVAIAYTFHLSFWSTLWQELSPPYPGIDSA